MLEEQAVVAHVALAGPEMDYDAFEPYLLGLLHELGQVFPV